jgi:hypothetical protein
LETLIHQSENEFIDKRNFLICNSCYWCASCLTNNDDKNEYMLVCPSCNLPELKPMLISDYESYKLDHKYIGRMALGLSIDNDSDRMRWILHI